MFHGPEEQFLALALAQRGSTLRGYLCLSQLACCCGSAGCALCCGCCPKFRQSRSTRFMYLFYFTLVIIPCCVMMSPSVMKQMTEHVSLWVLISCMRSLTWRTGFNLSVIGGPLLVCCCDKNILTRQLTQGRVYLSFWIRRAKSPSWWVGMTAHSRHGSRKLKAHSLNHSTKQREQNESGQSFLISPPPHSLQHTFSIRAAPPTAPQTAPPANWGESV